MINREKELKAFEAWKEDKIRSVVGLSESSARELLSPHMCPEGVWIARAELAAKDDEIISELAEALQFIACEDYGRPPLMMSRAREQLKKHAERIKQARNE